MVQIIHMYCIPAPVLKARLIPFGSDDDINVTGSGDTPSSVTIPSSVVAKRQTENSSKEGIYFEYMEILTIGILPVFLLEFWV